MEMVMTMTPFSKNQTIACLLNYKIFPHSTSNHPQCVKEAQSLCSIRHSTSSHHHQHNIGWFWSPDKRQKNPLRCVQVGHCVLCPSDTALCPTNCCGNIAAHRWTSLSTDQRLRTHIYKRSRVKFTKLQKKSRNVQKQAECDEDWAQIKHQLVSLGGICGLKKGTLLWFSAISAVLTVLLEQHKEQSPLMMVVNSLMTF